MAKKSRKQSKRLSVEFIEYCISGGAYFWSGYLVFFLCDKGFGWTLWWSKLSANLVGWIVNFTLQRYWVFNNKNLKGHQTQVTGRYLFITAVNFIIDYFIVAGLKAVGLSPYLGQFASAGFFTFWNYFWYKYWVFPAHFKKGKRKRHGLARIFAHIPHGHSAYRG